VKPSQKFLRTTKSCLPYSTFGKRFCCRGKETCNIVAAVLPHPVSWLMAGAGGARCACAGKLLCCLHWRRQPQNLDVVVPLAAAGFFRQADQGLAAHETESFCGRTRPVRRQRGTAHRWRSMRIKRFFAILRDLFLPQRRNSCQHCGGVHCIGACQFDSEKPRTATVQSSQQEKQPNTAAETKR